MTDNTLSPLQQYPPSWGVIIGAVLLVMFVFYIIMLVLTRKIKIIDNVEEIPLLSLEQKLSEIKNKYALQVQEIEKNYINKNLSKRQAFQKLSATLRNFTNEYSHTFDHTSTLQELEIKGAPPLLKDRIKEFYPGAFQEAESQQDVKKAVYDTLQVINLWH